MKTWLAWSLLILLLAACATAPQEDVAERIDAYLAELESSQGFSGAVLIARDGELLLSKGYGTADRDRQEPNTPRTHYRIHWLTMPFTAVAVLQLQAEGELEVQDSICRYLPDCPAYWQNITLHHLLTHTSGVSDWIQPWAAEADKPTTGLERVEQIRQQAPYFQPGAQFRYSENGYLILGAIIEVASGQPYDVYLQEHIFGPVGMENTGYQGGHIATGYDPAGRAAPVADVLFQYAAGGLYSTVEDLYLWDQALYGEQLLAQEYLDEMFTGYATTPSTDFKEAAYGYGWFVGETLGRRAILHGGAMSGYTAMMLRFPDQRVTVIVLRNYGLPLYDQLEIELARMVFGEQ